MEDKLLLANITALKRQIDRGDIQTIIDLQAFFGRLYHFQFSTLYEDRTLFDVIKVMEEVKEITFILDTITGSTIEQAITHIANLYPEIFK